MTEIGGDTGRGGSGVPPGFLGLLFDFSFQRFITLDILKFVYMIQIGLITVGALGAVVSAFSQGFGMGIVGLIVIPVVWLLALILARVYLELVAVIFRIADNTTAMAQR